VNSTNKLQKPIVSLSLNPAIDLTYEITDLKHDQKTRAITTSYDPGGTGINVGRALEKLNANSQTCCITSGIMGEFLGAMLKQELSRVYVLQVEGETRINTTILQQIPLRQYQINATGSVLNARQLDKLIIKFLQFCGQGIGILTGSLPPGTPDDTYCKINRELQKQGGCAIIDAPVEVMKKALDSNPFLIKPNLHELELLRKKKLSSIERIAAEARLIVRKGTNCVCVSLGEKGAILTNQENSYYCIAPEISIHSTVGAGDSLVAGLAYGFAAHKTPEQALKFAVACGAGTAAQSGTQLFNTEEIELLTTRIKVNTLDI
jgi:6-phosphofructokinase 2